jgi:hypothetical protein
MDSTENGVPVIYAGEAQLLSWSDTSTAGPKIVLALPDEDALEAFKRLTMGRKAGQRFMMAITLLGDDEKPAHVPNALMKSAAMVCKSNEFHRYVAEMRGEEFESPEERDEQAAAFVREYCGVSSRSELDTNDSAARKFKSLMASYRAFTNGDRS